MLTDRQNEILVSSIKIIAEKGVQGFTIKNLSNEIGISQPAIYRHFESKTEILLTILNQFKTFTSIVSERIASSNMNSYEKIHIIYSELMKKFIETPSLVSVIFAEEIFKSEKILNEKVGEIMMLNEKMLYSIVSEAQQKNEICGDFDAKYFVLFIMGGFRLLVKRWEMSKYKFDLLSEGEDLFKVVEQLIRIK
ncbi:MAG: TetR/AcrR family transcriptional regulator [Bacteroidales bacterium]|nr:TetR/AcrR family transcriptional regulator [Bacteroidales bacterium]